MERNKHKKKDRYIYRERHLRLRDLGGKDRNTNTEGCINGYVNREWEKTERDKERKRQRKRDKSERKTDTLREKKDKERDKL